MQRAKSGPESVSSTPTGSEKQYRLPYFLGEEWSEMEAFIESVYSYTERDADGRLQTIHSRQAEIYASTVKVEGQSYRLRQLGRHLLFRSLYSPPAGDMLFLPDTTPAEFSDTLKRRSPGRTILHLRHYRYADYPLFYYLFFDVDGTGFAIHADAGHNRKNGWRKVELERVDFRWDDFAGASLVLTASVKDLREICDRLFDECINRQLRMPLLAYDDLPRISLSWQNGSEESFRWLTRAVCLTEPGLLEAEEPIVAIYRAEIEGRRGGFLRVERGDRYEGDHYTSRRLMALCDLIFRLNPCTGTEWFDRSSSYGPYRQLQKSALRVRVEIDMPSAHEKAEAYLTLLEWLEDKLHDPEKRARFGLPPRIVA